MQLFAVLCFNLFISFAVACEVLCSINYRPVCGYDGECYVDARNVCLMKNINCKRKKTKLAVFKYIRPGMCNTSLKKCKPAEKETSKES